MREKFYFFGSFRETAQAIDDPATRLEYLEAVIRHGLGDEELELSPIVNCLMVQTRFTLDRSIDISNSASERGKKGGAPKGNQNASKDWNIVSKQANSNKNKLKQTKTSEEEVEVEEEVEDRVKEIMTTPTRNLDYINGMRNVEIKGRQYLRAWNDVTGDSSIMSSEVKKGIYNIQNTIFADEFKERVEKFETIKDLIISKKMEKYFYYQIWNWTLEKFLEHINKFYGDDTLIISRLAKKEEVSKALRILETPKEEKKSEEPKQEMTEEQRQQALATMQQARQKLLATKTS